jgi:AcrR family transcriptional regulator
LFSRRGIRAVGVEEVISRAAVAKAKLYHHFPFKDDLVLAFLEQRELRWTRQFVEAGARERGASAEECLLATAREIQETHAEGEEVPEALVEEYGQTGARGNELARAYGFQVCGQWQ